MGQITIVGVPGVTLQLDFKTYSTYPKLRYSKEKYLYLKKNVVRR